MKDRTAPEYHFSSSDTLDTLSSEEGESSIYNSPLRMERIIHGNFLDDENLVESEEDESSSIEEGDVFGGKGMIFPGINGEESSIISPYGGTSYSTRTRGMSEESENSIDPPFDKESLLGSPKSTAVSMSPPDNNTYLSNYRTHMPEDNDRQEEWCLELTQSIRNRPSEPPQADPNEPSLRDLIYGQNHLYPGEVINLANLFGSSI